MDTTVLRVKGDNRKEERCCDCVTQEVQKRRDHGGEEGRGAECEDTLDCKKQWKRTREGGALTSEIPQHVLSVKNDTGAFHSLSFAFWKEDGEIVEVLRSYADRPMHDLKY